MQSGGWHPTELLCELLCVLPLENPPGGPGHFRKGKSAVLHVFRKEARGGILNTPFTCDALHQRFQN